MRTKIPSTFPMTLLDMVNIVLERTIDRQIHAVLVMDGRIDEARMGKALRLVMDAEPILGCNVVDHPKRPFWKRRGDLGASSDCSVLETEDTSTEIERFILYLADPTHEPLVIVKVFRAKVDTIVLKINHIVADGGGAKEILYLLAGIYRKLGKEPDYKPVPNLRGNRSFYQVLQGNGLKKTFRMLRNLAQAEPVAAFPYHCPQREKHGLAIRRLEPGDFERLKRLGRQKNATINDLLLAAFYRTLFQVVPHDPGLPFPVNVPLDLRPFTKRKRAGAICNLGNGYYPAVLPSACVDFPTTLDNVQKEMQAWKAEGPRLGLFALADRKYLRPPIGVIRSHMEPAYDEAEKSGKMLQALTNIGVLEKEWLDFDGPELIDAYMVSPLFYPPNFIVGVSTFGELMTLTAVYCKEADGESAIEVFLDQMVKELRDIG